MKLDKNFSLPGLVRYVKNCWKGLPFIAACAMIGWPGGKREYKIGS